MSHARSTPSDLTRVAPASGIPVGRDIASALERGREYSFLPIEQLGNTFMATAKDAEHAATVRPVCDRWAKHAIATAGYTTGLPVGQFARRRVPPGRARWRADGAGPGRLVPRSGDRQDVGGELMRHSDLLAALEEAQGTADSSDERGCREAPLVEAHVGLQ